MALYAVASLMSIMLTLLMAMAIIGWALAHDRSPDLIDTLWLWDVWPFLWLSGLTVAAAGLVVEIVRVLREPRRIDVVR